MKNIYLISILSSLLLASCNTPEPSLPYVYESNPRYSWGYAEFYGAYYSQYGIKNNTVSLSLFSDSLKLNTKGELTGFGQYLFLEDVFISPTDTLLPLGTYRISRNAEEFTFYGGKNDTIDSEVYTKGAYIYYIEQNSSKSTIKLIVSGSFDLSINNGKYKIVCDFKTDDNNVLKGIFNADLSYYDQSVIPQSLNEKRDQIKFKNQVKLY